MVYSPLEQTKQRPRGIRAQKLLLEAGTQHRRQSDRSKRFSELGLTHIAHLLEPDGKLITWTGIKGLASSKGTPPPCTREEFDALGSDIPAFWYKVLDRITDGTNTQNPPSKPKLIQTIPLPNGSWVSLTTNGMRIITQTGGSSNLQYKWLEHGDMREVPSLALPQQFLDPQHPQQLAHPPIPHPTRVDHNPSTQKWTAGGGQRWQYGRTEDNLQRAYAVMNGGLAAKRIVPNSDNPANGSRQQKRLVCGGTIVSRALFSLD